MVQVSVEGLDRFCCHVWFASVFAELLAIHDWVRGVGGRAPRS